MALDYHATSTATDRGAYQDTIGIVSGTEKRDVSDALDLLAIDDTVFMNRIGWGPESGGLSIEWISENLGPGYVVAGSVKASAGTSLQIATVEGLTTAQAARQLLTGTLLYHYSSTDGEHGLYLLVSVGSDGECEVERLSTATTFSVNTSTTAGDKMYILGNPANEGSLPRNNNFKDRVVNSNGFTIERQDVQITGSHQATDFYAIGKEDQHQLRMCLINLKRAQEKSALYSVHVTPRSSTEASLMNGALGFLVGQTGSHIDTTTTTLTETAVNTVVGECWESGSTNLTFFGDKNQCAKFTQWDKNRIRMAPRDARGGGFINYYMTEVGVELEIVPMRKVPTNIAFVIDTSKCRLRAKRGRKGVMKQLGAAGDFDDWQIISEFSLEMKGYNLNQHGLFTRLS
ncbi:MAG: DUF5309 family protein [Chloroflexota bacterium]|nr:DUF5309 family protein [Chloroflexota bacterium]